MFLSRLQNSFCFIRLAYFCVTLCDTTSNFDVTLDTALGQWFLLKYCSQKDDISANVWICEGGIRKYILTLSGNFFLQNTWYTSLNVTFEVTYQLCHRSCKSFKSDHCVQNGVFYYKGFRKAPVWHWEVGPNYTPRITRCDVTVTFEVTILSPQP